MQARWHVLSDFLLVGKMSFFPQQLNKLPRQHNVHEGCLLANITSTEANANTPPAMRTA